MKYIKCHLLEYLQTSWNKRKLVLRGTEEIRRRERCLDYLRMGR